jgi:hypothetical protein
LLNRRKFNSYGALYVDATAGTVDVSCAHVDARDDFVEWPEGASYVPSRELVQSIGDREF